MPGWIPLYSASSGAAFSGVLAALVITISVQIATRVRTPGSQALSLKASPPTLVTLMLATYLYIVLDGIPTSPAEVAGLAGEDTLAALDESQVAEAMRSYATSSAQGFATAGSVLAIGALMTLFVVTASIFDNTARGPSGGVESDEIDARGWALSVFMVATWTVAGILLLGYKVGSEISQTVDGRGPDLSAWWWLAHVAALVAPLAFVTAFANRRWSATNRVHSLRRAKQRLHVSPTAIIIVVAAAPAVLTQLSVATRLLQEVPVPLVSALSGLYFSGCASILLLTLLERQEIYDGQHP
ncbi:hypothetical protein [Aeromicrobium sp. Sec7.5]|uniref:hypothetical protein n=1 Tax=Aeromicrobium sp. Sec7.5 TaxID=3121276 RepID=UPI002FE49D44